MTIKSHPNIEILENALLLLGPLADEMVFIGGCATGLLITDPGANPIRATIDMAGKSGSIRYRNANKPIISPQLFRRRRCC